MASIFHILGFFMGHCPKARQLSLLQTGLHLHTTFSFETADLLVLGGKELKPEGGGRGFVVICFLFSLQPRQYPFEEQQEGAPLQEKQEGANPF